MEGYCSCGNISVFWHVSECSLRPRACQCSYCLEKGAAYISQPQSQFDLYIKNASTYRTLSHGSNLADFHECTNCDEVVAVTAEINGSLYGVINAKQLSTKDSLEEPVISHFSDQTPAQKIDRWRQNWCHPVFINFR